MLSRINIVTLCLLLWSPARADEKGLCVSTKDGVVHITSASEAQRGGGSCEKDIAQSPHKRTHSVSPDGGDKLKRLPDSTSLRKFATSTKTGLLANSASTALSGPVGAAWELWMRLNERVTDATAKPFVVVQYGDSHSQGGTLPDQIRRRLAHDPISPGLLNVGFPMNWGASVLKTGRWKRRNWLRDKVGSFGPLGIVFDSIHPGDELTLRLPEDPSQTRVSRVTVLYDATNGQASFVLKHDSQRLAQLDEGVLTPAAGVQGALTNDDMSNLARLQITIPLGVNRMTLEAGLGTSVSKPLSVYGFVVQYEGALLEWDNLGVSGTEIGHLLEHGDGAVEGYLKWRNPDLFVLWFGTNSLNDPRLTSDGYRRLFRTYLDRMAGAAPNATCLVIGPPDFMKRPRQCFMSSAERSALKGRRTRWKRRLLAQRREQRVCEPQALINHRKRGRYRFPVPGVRTMDDWRKHTQTCEYKTVPMMQEIVEIQRTVAQEAGCLFFDTLKFMGGPGAMHDWVCNKPKQEASLDHIHLTTRGYRKVGDGIVDEINEALERLKP